MKKDEIKYPVENAVAKLRELYYKRKEERKKHYNELRDAWRKEPTQKKVAKPNDVEV